MSEIGKGRLNLVSIAGALLLFLLPWIDINCSGLTVATQSGLQTILAEASLAGGLDVKDPDEVSGESDAKEHAWIVGVAGCVVLLALVAAIAGARSPGRFRKETALLGAIAGILIVIQMIDGFPVQRSIREKLDAPAESRTGTAEFGADLKVSATFTPWIFVTIAAFAGPAAVLLSDNGTPRSSKGPLDVHGFS